MVSFDKKLFNSSCKLSSSTHDPTIDVGVAVQELFCYGKDWIDRETLFYAAKSIGKAQGFHIVKKTIHSRQHIWRRHNNKTLH